MNEHHGLIFVEPTPEDYHQNGLTRLAGQPMQANGQWDAYCPPDELQAQYMEPSACATFGTLNCVEALLRNLYGIETNWSDRFLAWKSGTTIRGNDPNTVAETLRKQGTVYETDWPYTKEINTWPKFYATPPFDIEVQAQAKFRGKYAFGHQWCGTDPQSMMNALMYSPLGADAFAWNQPDATGIYHREGMGSTHWIMIYGFLKGKYWKCLDSYDNTHKKLAWDFGFTMVKQYTLNKQVLTVNPLDPSYLWAQAIRFFQKILGL